ncbi:hypothetical protein GCM10011504_22280 [Siccirubricoccus deserti]|uniref:Uncharacterized protein n=1 Tax=Siccirubricoccus deserti TaxID=2013562 RepID=A0A9X0QX87_9PROT|nr:hypothetical protein [Siccirubricoccus deserti]MBC4015644.1 hypothetical protein [Siccirubricoccus deserti]GGC43410.1 hypothetical protein GCM10011504_22280 [Siccirubricoccus deserti]
MASGSKEEQRAWIARVLGIAAPPDPAAPSLTARLQATGARLQAMKAAADPRLANLLPGFAAATAAVKAGTPDAAALIEALEGALAGPAAAQATSQASSPGVRPPVDFRALAERWRAAEGGATQALAEIGAAILALDEVKADPRYKHVVPAMRALPGLLPPAGAALAAALAGADGPAAARDALRGYRQALAAASALARLEAVAARHVGARPVRAPLEAAMQDIEQALAEVA